MDKNVLYIIFCVVIITSFLIIGCAKDDNTTEETRNNITEDQPAIRTITIGNLTDITGPGALGIAYVDMALTDMVEYYNENNIIPGVKLEITEYDTQYDTARVVAGYERLLEANADFIWTPCPIAVPILKPRVDMDEVVTFAATATLDEGELEGGFLFSVAITPEDEAYTLLDWIAKNDKDFPDRRPAIVGAAGWNDAYQEQLFEAAENYCKTHSEIYEWDVTFLTEFKFDWTAEVDELKDCDYVFVPVPPNMFIKDFSRTGGNAKFLGTDPVLAFLRDIDKMGLWEEIDGMYFLRSSRWYNESGPIIDITNQLLDAKHSPQEAEEIRQQGVGYIASKQIYLMLDILKQAVENVGAENFNSQALYKAATEWQFGYEGIPVFHSFTETERIPTHFYAVYEANGNEQGVFRAHEEWIPKITSLE